MSKVPLLVFLATLADHRIVRCTARPEDLDGEGGRRSCEHTELLVSELELGVLWDEYGLVGDVVVHITVFLIWFYLEILAAYLLTCIVQPFTNDFPRADIHELIAPDILHQLIKGTFKDHLVSWIQDYIILTHGTAEGNEILDDIDRRYVVLLLS